MPKYLLVYGTHATLFVRLMSYLFVLIILVLPYHLKAASLAEQCAVSLCGAPQNVPSPVLFNTNIKNFVQKEALKRSSALEPKLKFITEMKLNDNDRLIKALKQRFQRPFQFHFESWSEVDYYEIAWILFNSYVTFTSKIHRPFHTRLSYFITLPGQSNPIMKRGISSYAMRKQTLIEHSYSLGLQEGFYNLEEARAILQNNWDTFFLKYQGHKNDNHVFTQTFEPLIQDLRQKIHGNTIETFDNLLQLAKDLEHISNQFGAVFQQNFNGLSREFYYLCRDSHCKEAVRQEIQKLNFENLIENFEQTNKKKELLIKEKLTYCQSYFASQIVDHKESSQLKELIEEIRQSLFSRVLDGANPQLVSSLEKYFNDHITFSLTNGSKNVQKFLHTIEQKYNEITTVSSEDYFSYSNVDLIKKLLSYYDRERDRINPLRTIDICPNSLSTVLWDSFIPKNNVAQEEALMSIDLENKRDNIILSPFTQSYSDYGRGIIAHELSHALIFVIINSELSPRDYPTKFSELRECAKSWYPIQKNRELYMEDMADLVSYLSTYDTPYLYSCTLLKRSLDGNAYSDVTFHSIDKEIFHFAKNSQSSSRGRSQRKRILTSSCQELLNRNQKNFNMKVCF